MLQKKIVSLQQFHSDFRAIVGKMVSSGRGVVFGSRWQNCIPEIKKTTQFLPWKFHPASPIIPVLNTFTFGH